MKWNLEITVFELTMPNLYFTRSEGYVPFLSIDLTVYFWTTACVEMIERLFHTFTNLVGSALTFDWSVNCFIIAVYKKTIFSRNLDRKFWLNS